MIVFLEDKNFNWFYFTERNITELLFKQRAKGEVLTACSGLALILVPLVVDPLHHHDDEDEEEKAGAADRYKR